MRCETWLRHSQRASLKYMIQTLDDVMIVSRIQKKEENQQIFADDVI